MFAKRAGGSEQHTGESRTDAPGPGRLAISTGKDGTSEPPRSMFFSPISSSNSLTGKSTGELCTRLGTGVVDSSSSSSLSPASNIFATAAVGEKQMPSFRDSTELILIQD